MKIINCNNIDVYIVSDIMIYNWVYNNIYRIDTNIFITLTRYEFVLWK